MQVAGGSSASANASMQRNKSQVREALETLEEEFNFGKTADGPPATAGYSRREKEKEKDPRRAERQVEYYASLVWLDNPNVHSINQYLGSFSVSLSPSIPHKAAAPPPLLQPLFPLFCSFPLVWPAMHHPLPTISQPSPQLQPQPLPSIVIPVAVPIAGPRINTIHHHRPYYRHP